MHCTKPARSNSFSSSLDRSRPSCSRPYRLRWCRRTTCLEYCIPSRWSSTCSAMTTNECQFADPWTPWHMHLAHPRVALAHPIFVTMLGFPCLSSFPWTRQMSACNFPQETVRFHTPPFVPCNARRFRSNFSSPWTPTSCEAAAFHRCGLLLPMCRSQLANKYQPVPHPPIRRVFITFHGSFTTSRIFMIHPVNNLARWVYSVSWYHTQARTIHIRAVSNILA